MQAIIATLSPFGANADVIWVFAAGVLVVFFTIALIVMGIELIKTLINQ